MAISCRRVTGNPNIHEYEGRAAGAANEIQPGDLVRLDSNGELILAATAHILGICHKASSTTDSTKIPVDVLGVDDTFSIPCNTTTTEAHIGTTCDVTFTTGAQVATTGGTTDLYCVDLDSIDAVTTDGGRLICRVLPAALIMV